MNNHLFSQCPWCTSTEVKYRGDISYHDQPVFSDAPIELSRIPQLWHCEDCGSCFVQNVLPEVDARNLYSEGDSSSRWSQVPFQEQKSIEILHILDSFLLPGSRVLDIGCNTGELLDYAKSRGCVTEGIEYSGISRQLLEKKGHSAHSNMDGLTGNYDVITAFDLLEHMYSPAVFLCECSKLLTENGVCIILTGDIECLSARLTGPRWWYLRYPEHMVFPSRRFLSRYNGMKLQRIVRTYASKGYNSSFLTKLKSIIRYFIRNNYDGLPSIGPDHILAVLTK